MQSFSTMYLSYIVTINVLYLLFSFGITFIDGGHCGTMGTHYPPIFEVGG